MRQIERLMCSSRRRYSAIVENLSVESESYFSDASRHIVFEENRIAHIEQKCLCYNRRPGWTCVPLSINEWCSYIDACAGMYVPFYPNIF